MLTAIATLSLLRARMRAPAAASSPKRYDAWHNKATARGLVVEWISMSEAIARSLTGTVKGGFDDETRRGWLR